MLRGLNLTNCVPVWANSTMSYVLVRKLPMKCRGRDILPVARSPSNCVSRRHTCAISIKDIQYNASGETTCVRTSTRSCMNTCPCEVKFRTFNNFGMSTHRNRVDEVLGNCILGRDLGVIEGRVEWGRTRWDVHECIQFFTKRKRDVRCDH